jgi:cytochrome P450
MQDNLESSRGREGGVSPSGIEAPLSHELNWPPPLRPFDFDDFEIQAAPFAHYAWMRRHAPVLRVRTPRHVLYLLSRYHDIQTVLRFPKLYSSTTTDVSILPRIVLMDPPEHTRLRQIVAMAFTPKAISRSEAEIRKYANQYLTPIVAAGGGEIVDTFAVRLTMATISRLLGVPVRDFDQMKAWTTDQANYFGRVSRHALGAPGDEAGMNELHAYLIAHLNRLAESSTEENVASNIANLWKEGKLTLNEAKHFCAFLFSAGHETTTTLIANGMLTLADLPDLVNRLKANPGDLARFIEELIRFRSSVQRITRVAKEESVVAGYRVPAGAVIKLLVGSANRDPEKFPNGEVFNIDRDTSGHFGFGHGIHSCLGAWLARTEARIAFDVLLQMIDSFEIDRSQPIEQYTGGTMALSGPARMSIRVKKSVQATTELHAQAHQVND